jgi:hypothetical protein
MLNHFNKLVKPIILGATICRIESSLDKNHNTVINLNE